MRTFSRAKEVSFLQEMSCFKIFTPNHDEYGNVPGLEAIIGRLNKWALYEFVTTRL